MGLKPQIEVPLLLMFFSMELLGPVTTNLMIYRTCYITLGYNESECALLGNSNNSTIEDLEKIVEPEMNIIDTTRSMMEQVVALTMCLFAGQWSDRFGRKPVLVISQIGIISSVSMMAILAYFPNVSPWYFLFCSVPSMLTGGFSTFLVATLAYISDITTEESRGMRMAIMEGVIGVGILFGNICSSYLFYATNYPSVYLISAGINSLSVLYVVFFLRESLANIDTEGKSLDIFQSSNLKEMFSVFSKKRQNHNKAIIHIITAMLTIYIFMQAGGSKTFLFLRGKFDWTLTQFTWYNSVSNIFFMLGSVFGTLVLYKWLRITESVLILVGIICEMNGNLVRGLATKNFHIYFSAVVKLLAGLISPQSRTLVAKLVPTDEIGKIFSLIMVIEFVCGIAASPLYTAIYNATVNTNPAIYNFFSAGLCGIDVILIIIIIVLENMVPRKYVKLDDEEEPIAINNADLIAGI